MSWQRYTVEETENPFRPGEDTYVVIDARTGDVLFECGDRDVCDKWRDKWVEENS